MYRTTLVHEHGDPRPARTADFLGGTQMYDLLIKNGAVIDDTGSAPFMADIATLQGQLRAVHLRAHVVQRSLLTPEQLQRYDVLRGYATSHPHTTHPHRSH